MEDEKQVRAYARADFSEPHSAFINEFQQKWPGCEICGHALDLGCGPADITVRFANRYKQCSIDGIDGSEAMLSYGRKAIAQHGLEFRINLHQIYIPQENLPRADYDVIISNSLLHHLQDPLMLWETIKRHGKQGAPVFIMDLLRPDTTQQAKLLVETYASDEAEILQHDFYHSLLAAYNEKEIRQQLEITGLDYFHVEEVSDRHITVSGRLGKS